MSRIAADGTPSPSSRPLRSGGVLADVALLLAGISPNVFVFLGPLTIAHSAFVHANLNWTLGPFKYVVAGPVFHRWHHTAAREGMDKNFAPTFPWLDVIFGTFYMPAGRVPTEFGNGAGILFLGYCLLEVPSNMILYRVGARVWLARIMISWGLISAATIFVDSKQG